MQRHGLSRKICSSCLSILPSRSRWLTLPHPAPIVGGVIREDVLPQVSRLFNLLIYVDIWLMLFFSLAPGSLSNTRIVRKQKSPASL